jgi:XTP/dITP diphosphohydrolase
MNSLLIATTNPAKLAEYRVLLRGFDLRLVSLRDAGIDAEAPEDAESFVANARLKARFYFERAGIATLADDGGLEVDALGGAPGARSHRWLGAEPDDRALAEAIIERTSRFPPERRSARLRAAAVLIYRSNGKTFERVAEAAQEGIIADLCYSQIRTGFPYRSVFFLPELGRYLAELDDDEAARLSQRKAALELLRADLQAIARL